MALSFDANTSLRARRVVIVFPRLCSGQVLLGDLPNSTLSAMAGFTAYIDESGCDGFNLQAGTSEFLILGSVITRTANLKQFDEATSEMNDLAAKPSDWRLRTFKKLNSAPSQRWLIAKGFSALRIQVVAVAIHKPSLREKGWKVDKDDLYFQASKFLLERISWSCRDAHAAQSAGPDPMVDVVFSKRGKLRYDRLAEYMARLKSDPKAYGTNADWNHLDPQLVRAEPHSDSNACHIATDHFVSAVGAALERKVHGMFDDRYVRIWGDKFYRPKQRVLNNGLKFWPSEGLKFIQDDERGGWLEII